MSAAAIRQAVILAGGKGTRLGALTQRVPKPMLPIAGGQPFLDYLLEMVERHGYEDIILLGGYLGEVLEAAYDRRRIGAASIRVLREQAPLGTAGALRVAREKLDARFLMMNGDAFFDINLRALEQASRQSGAMATLALQSVPDTARYGRVIEERGKVVAFMEKDPNRPGPGIINGGVYVLKREILDFVLDLPCSLEENVFPTLVERGEIRGLTFDRYFLDIGLPETLEQGHRELPNVRRRPAAFLDLDVLVGLSGAAEPAQRLQWRPGAAEAVRALNDGDFYVFVAKHGSADASGLAKALLEPLAHAGAHVDRIYDDGGGRAADGASVAPAPGARPILAAMREWPIMRERSFYIGVRPQDVEAARGAGIAAHAFDGSALARLVHSLLAQLAQGSIANHTNRS